jgi:signal transduction histidine kinase
MGRLGLSARLMAIGASAMLVLWLLILAAYYRSNAASFHDSSPERLAAITSLLSRTDADERAGLAAAFSEPTLSLALATLDPNGHLSGSPAAVALAGGVDVTGRPEFSAHRALLGKTLVSIRAREGRVLRPLLLRWGGARFLPLAYVLRLKDGAILIVEGRLAPGFNLFGLPVGLGAGLAGTLMGLLVLLLVQREIRPLLTLARAADRMDPSGPPIPLPAASGRTREVRSLIQAFGRLQDRLQLLLTSRLALLSGVQHDVRSFATRLRLRVEAIPDPTERERAVKDIEDMIRLLDDALVSARAGSGSLDEELIELGEWLTAEVADLGRNGVPLTLGSLPPEPVEVLADRVALKRILGNLVDNAVKYGTRAEVALLRSGEQAVLRVRDAGPGIAPEMRALLLEPFTRGEPSRARKTGGAGLGLAIVQTLSRAHGGTIEIGDAPGGGAEVRVSLPLFVPQAPAD